MRSLLFLVSMLIILSSCTSQKSSPTTPQPIEYPTTQSGSPAAQFCIQKGGQVSYEKNPDIPNMDMIYCTPVGGQKIDAWKYMGEGTTNTGTIQPPAL